MFLALLVNIGKHLHLLFYHTYRKFATALTHLYLRI